MKRFIIGFCLVAIALPLVMGQVVTPSVQPVMLASPRTLWTELGTIAGTTTTLAVGNRDYTTVAAIADANQVEWNLANWGRKEMISFQTNANADSHVVEVWAFADNKAINTSGIASLDDDAVYGGTLTLTGGQQTGKHSNVYVDTVDVSDANGVFDYTVRDSANDRRATVEFQDKGFKRIVFITTTQQASSTLYIEGRSWQ